MNTVKSQNPIFKHLGVLITLLSAILYFLGLTYYQSFLLELGVEETQFPLSIDRILFQGFVSSIHLGVESLAYFLIIVLGVVSVVFLCVLFLEFVKEFAPIKKLSNKLKGLKSDEVKPDKLVDFAVNIFEFSIYIVIALLVILFVALASQYVGGKAGQVFISQCLSGDLRKHKVRVAENQENILACPIVCNSSECAYLEGKVTKVIGKRWKNSKYYHD